MKALVLDTSAVLRLSQDDIEQLSKDGLIFVPEAVINELKKDVSLFYFSTFRDKVSIISPSKKTLKKILEMIKKANKSLSSTDIEVISLAYELKSKGYDVMVLSEDYEIQNALSLLGIKYSSVKGKKIRYVTIFKKKCKACGFVYDVHLDECPNCGSSEFAIIKKVIRSAN